MTKLDIIKNNKMIALFMGGKTHDMNSEIVSNHTDIWVPFHGVCNCISIELGAGKILQYHKSWDWLIPVVSLCSDVNERLGIHFEFSLCYMITNDILNTYVEVVKCIYLINNHILTMNDDDYCNPV